MKLRIEYITFDSFNAKIKRKTNQIFEDYILKSEQINEYIQIFKNEVYLWTDRKGNIHAVLKDEELNWKNKHYAVDGYIGDSIEVANEKTAKAPDGIGAQAIKDINRFAKVTNEDYEISEEEVFRLLGIDSFDDIYCEPYLFCDPNYACRKLEHIWSYDMNSCYPYFLTKELPYGKNLGCGKVQEDEIGFIESPGNGKILLKLELKTSGYAQFRFKKKEYKCFKMWAEHGYVRKQTDHKFKVRFNAMLGAMKYHNIFIRAAVLGYAREFMESKKDENTIMQTVDNIVSLKSRDDLDIGLELGQFKLEHVNATLTYISNMIKRFNLEREKHSGISATRYASDTTIYDNPRYVLTMYKPNRFEIQFIESTTSPTGL